MSRPHKVTLTSRAFRNDQLPLLYKELHDLTGFDMALPMNSGAEAVETAMKAARKWGYKVKGIPEGKAEIIVCANNFHGRTITIVSFSTDEQYRDGFGPFTPGFKIIPFGDADALRGRSRQIHVLSWLSPSRAKPGILIPPDGLSETGRGDLPRRTTCCSLLTRFSRASDAPGKLFACKHEEVRPDMVIVGKALSGGFYPVSAVLSSKEVLGSSIPATTAVPSAAIRWPAPSRARRCAC